MQVARLKFCVCTRKQDSDLAADAAQPQKRSSFWDGSYNASQRPIHPFLECDLFEHANSNIRNAPPKPWNLRVRENNEPRPEDEQDWGEIVKADFDDDTLGQEHTG